MAKIEYIYLSVAILFIIVFIQQSFIYDLKSQIKIIANHKPRLEHNKNNNENMYLNLKAPKNLPSVLLTNEEEEKVKHLRKIYGGKNDALHLGGFTKLDRAGISKPLWNFMMGPLAIKSILDIGCGKGVSTLYFKETGAKVLCVEGSHDAVTQSLLPSNEIVEHDFTRGPWWPDVL